MPESIRIELSPTAAAERAAESLTVLTAIADPVRWAVLDLLGSGTHCVCDLQAHVEVAANLLSYHLKVLRDAGLVTTARRGRWVDYTLAPDAHERLAHALPTAGAARRSAVAS
ncbi:metalloregulator ArsR/SmtB family transcription factor [Isoptericola sp. b441]|uniref:Metalloregulator ArsR/SmtB family transcription factor n=1 Tax=Actinotalea lenta TaxID=3064654 RepID=A0ABT9D9D4_9CELL|nr:MULTISPECIES: metalloregulator ArsR/SmtB family transcription factor [unclassified Isoptericola]MDO8106733.1 metalloregulator ArsR/SmtB family transcription factor [Isoptericola sp. b441]MDO8121555.1 metalloregulator ArsR/SmtB family transcription factor [Isoptericola sp. b490]